EAPGLAEVHRHAADEKRGIAAGLGENEGHQRGRGGLARVPATTTERREVRNSSDKSAGNETSGMWRSVAASTSTWSRRHTLPTTTRSGAQSRFAGRKPSITGMF